MQGRWQSLLFWTHTLKQKKYIETKCNKQVIRAHRWILTTYFSWGVGFNESCNITRYSRTWKICCKVLAFCLGSPKIKQGKRVCVALTCLGTGITQTEIFLCLQRVSLRGTTDVPRLTGFTEGRARLSLLDTNLLAQRPGPKVQLMLVRWEDSTCRVHQCKKRNPWLAKDPLCWSCATPHTAAKAG